MRLVAAKWFAMAVLSTAAFGVACAPNDAEACCGFFRNLFGCCGGGCYGGGCGYGPRMSPCGPAGCGVTYSNYGCSPCSVGCSPCGISPCGTGGCATGNCGVSIPASCETTAPNENWQKSQQKTYADPAPADGTAKETEPGKLQNDGTGASLGTGAFKPGQLPGNTVQGFKPAAQADSNASGSKASSPASSKESKKGPPAKKADGDEGSNSGKRPAISIDDKVASRSAPLRTRIENRSHTGTARLVRLPAYPASDWIPVDSDSKVAKK